MQFGLNNKEKFEQEWGNYNTSLYKSYVNELTRTMSKFENILHEHVVTDIRQKNITDEQTIIGIVKYWSNQIIRDCIKKGTTNNQVKGITNRFYIENYDYINMVCNNVLSLFIH